MPRRQIPVLSLTILLVGTTVSTAVPAQITAARQQEIDALDASVTEAARLFQQKKFRQCSEAVREVQTKYEQLAAGGDAELIAALQKVYGRLAKAHALLELEGFALPPLKKPDTMADESGKPDEPSAGTGEATVSFAADIAPLLAEHCLNCHGRARRPSGRLDLVTFAGLLRGGDNGPPVTPGKAQESLLIGKLRGTADGERMPLRQPPLSDEAIAKIETWITDGAKFDGPDESQDIEQLAKLSWAERATAEEITAERAELALKNWGLGMPGVSPDRTETQNFLLLGNVGEEALQQYGELAESLLPTVRELCGVPDDRTLVKGRITLYVLAQRYDYTEFGAMVEKRQLPRDWQGHWTYNVVDAYGVSVAPQGGATSRDALLTEQLVGLHVAGLGEIPRWFAEGSGRAAAGRAKPDDPRVQAWDGQVSEVIAAMTRPDDFMTGKASAERTAVAGYSFVKLLLTDTGRYRALLDGLRGGKEFEAAFTDAYGRGLSQIAELWANRAARGK
jgi:hypothetical protein